MSSTYSYNPSNLKEKGKDLMRFELGDTMTEGKSDTCALTDEEIIAAIETYPKSWKRAKLMLLESIFRRFSYEVDTKTGSLSLSLSERAKLWKEEYENLKEEVKRDSQRPPTVYGRQKSRPYFTPDMHKNMRSIL